MFSKIHEATELYRRHPNVSGVLYGLKSVNRMLTNEKCLIFNVKRKLSRSVLPADQLLPGELFGLPTDVVEVNHKACGSPSDRFGVVQPGVSIGAEGQTDACTLGCLAYTSSGDVRYISAYHSLVQADPADHYTLQPGAGDGGISSVDRCGYYWEGDLTSRGDRAIGKLTRPYEFGQFPTGETITSARLPEIGDVVEKCGRATGVTRGQVSAIGTIWNIDFGSFHGSVSITGFVVTPISDPTESIATTGDSGALWYLPTQSIGLGIVTSATTGTVQVFNSNLSWILEDYDLSLSYEAASPISVWSPVSGFKDPAWIQVGDEVCINLPVTPSVDLKHTFLFTDIDYVASDGILWGKREVDSEYKLIGPFSKTPSCFLGDIPSGTTTTLNLKLKPTNTLDLSGQYSAPIYIGHGETFVGGLMS